MYCLLLLHAACTYNCTAVTPDEIKCMTNEGEKNGTDVGTHCQGVDFDALAKGDVSGTADCSVKSAACKCLPRRAYLVFLSGHFSTFPLFPTVLHFAGVLASYCCIVGNFQ